MTLLAWGSNSLGQLSVSFLSEQVLKPTLTNITDNSILAITGGGNHSILLTRSGSTYAAGCNDDGQSGFGSISNSTQFLLLTVPFSAKVSKVSCGWNFSVCILDDGKVLGWGSNSFKQLGLNELKTVQEPRLLDVPLCIDVSCGLRHILLVTIDGFVYGSGSNRKCQLGGPPEKFIGFRKVNKLESIKAVKCGENFSIALSTSKVVYSWGENKYGQTGKSYLEFKLIDEPAAVSLDLLQKEDIKEIFCGWANSAVLTDKGTVYTWGRNDYGQLGDQDRILTWQPSAIKTQFTFSNIALGSQHTIALTFCKHIVSWGWNEHGSCGDGTLENKLSPTCIDLPPKFSPEGLGSGAAHSFVWGIVRGKFCSKRF